LTQSLLQGRLDRQAHATVQQRRRNAAMHSAGRIQLRAARYRGSDHATPRNLSDFVSDRLSEAVKRQAPVNEALDEFETAHLLAFFVRNRSVTPGRRIARHRFSPMILPSR